LLPHSSTAAPGGAPVESPAARLCPLYAPGFRRPAARLPHMPMSARLT
jgi:hypothetical protein